MAATALTLLVVGLDMTVLNVALPDIAESLHASAAQLQWFADAYLLVLAAMLMPAGLLGDRFGRKRLTVIALAVFGTGSLICAVAWSPGVLILGRAVLGAGASVLVPLGMSAVVVLFEPAERGRAVLLLSLSTLVGLPLGPIVAGALLRNLWWGSVFAINVPVVLVALIAVLRFLPESRERASSGRVDVVGAVASGLGLLGFTYGMIEGPQRGWADPLILASLIAGVLVLIAFVAYEKRRRGIDPLFDLRLWADPRFRWGAIGATLASLAFFGLMFEVPQYYRALLHTDALGAGLRTLPMVGGLLVSMRLAMLLGRRIPVGLLAGAGFLVTAVGLALGARTHVGTGYGWSALWTALTGFGFGTALFVCQNAALMSLPRDGAARGSSTIQALRQAGSVVGIAVLGAISNGVYRDQLSASVPASPVRAVALQGIQPAVAQAGTSPVTAMAARHAEQAFVAGMDVTLWVSAGLALVGGVLVAVLLRGRTTDAGSGVEQQPDRSNVPDRATV